MTLPYIITVAHKKGGVSKTTTACNIAVELYKKFDTTLIDLDSQKHFTVFNQKRDEPIKQKEIVDNKELKKYVKNDKGLTIIDIGGYDSELSRMAMLLSDLIITPVGDSPFELLGLKEFQKIVNVISERNEDIKSFVLISRIHHADKQTHKDVKKFLKKKGIFEIFDTVITDRKIHKHILIEGKNVCEIDESSKASKEIRSLVGEIIKKA